MAQILIVDDESHNRIAIKEILTREGHHVHEACNGNEAIQEILRLSSYDVVLTDIKMPGMDGISFYKHLISIKEKAKPEERFPEVIFMTAYGKLEEAVEMLRLGAVHFIAKPLRKKDLVSAVDEALQKRPTPLYKGDPEDSLIACSKKMQEVVSLVDRVASSSASVLFVGESGTGKEVFARRLHQRSGFANFPFTAFHCGAVPESLLESELFGYEKGAFTGAEKSKPGLLKQTHGGSFFIDELSSMPSTIQTKLLRVIQEREYFKLGSVVSEKVDLRWISATNVSLEQMQKNGFREDLLFRLKVILIEIPALREHPDDITPLCHYFNSMFAKREARDPLTIDSETLGYLSSYLWPGNIRELGNVVERALALSTTGVFSADLLPPHIRVSERRKKIEFEVGTSLSQMENILFEETLSWCDGDKNRAAAVLGVTPRTIYRWLDKNDQK